MRNRSIVIFTCLLFAVVFSSGCARTACNRICDWLEDCGYDDSECEDDCVSDYYDGDWDCRSAMRDFGRCVDDKDCSEATYKCDDELEDLGDECSDDFGYYYKAVPESKDGAAGESHCDYQCTLEDLFFK